MALNHSFMQRATAHIEDYVEFVSDIIHVDPQGEDAQRAREEAHTLISHFVTLIAGFLDGVWGEPQEGMVTVNFPSRFMGSTSSFVTPQLRCHLESTYLAGIVTHYLLTTFPNRANVDRSDILELKERYRIIAVAADRMMRGYDRENDRLPSKFAKLLFRRRVAPFLKTSLGFGWHKRAKAESFFLNIFFAGVLLAFMADLELATG